MPLPARTRRSSRHPSGRRTAVVALLALPALLAPALPAGAAPGGVQPTRVEPESLTRGADLAAPHVEGTTFVDGAQRVAVDASRLELLGPSGPDHLLTAFAADGRATVVRISSSGAVTPVLSPARNGDLVTLSADGTRLAQAKVRGGFTKSSVTVWSAADGSVLARRTFPGIQSVLDLDRREVVLGDVARTRVWRTGANPAKGTVRVLAERGGYRADLAADRLATFTGDPYDGGCTVVSRISDPAKRLWRSCAERVEDFSPGGRRMATVDLLSDGIGPGQVLLRTAVGKPKGVYRVKGYFGQLLWSGARVLVLETFGRTQGALVQCNGSACQRVSELVPTPAPHATTATTAAAGGRGLPAAFRVAAGR